MFLTDVEVVSYRPRKAVPSRFASLEGWGTRHVRRASWYHIGKPRTFLVRGFSMIHAPDTGANTYGRALLFAENHISELTGRNPRLPHFGAAGGYAIGA